MKSEVICDVCHQRPARYTAPIRKAYGSREHIRDEHWCEECHDAILASQPGRYLWRHRDGWFGPTPTPMERSLLRWFRS